MRVSRSTIDFTERRQRHPGTFTVDYPRLETVAERQSLIHDTQDTPCFRIGHHNSSVQFP